MRPDELRCEYEVNPLGIDACRPRLSWQTPAAPRGSRQSAYRIVVAGSAAALDADGEVLWDSGKVASERSVNVPYAGRELGSGERCWWRVRTWDREGRAGAWSEPAWFEMGLLQGADWPGAWIAAERGSHGESYDARREQARFWAKWSDDLGDSQRLDGKLPVISPLHWRGSTFDPDGYDPYGDMPVWWSSYAAMLPGIDNVTEDVDAITLRAGSGNYHFRLSAR